MTAQFKRAAKRAYHAIHLRPTSCVLMLHSVGAPQDSTSGSHLSRDRFLRLLESFSNFDHLNAVVTNPRQRKIAITFDDGLEDIYTVIYPLLKERNIPFTTFISFDLLDTPGYMTREQVKELSCDPLVTIGSHCGRHVPLAKQTKEVQRAELLDTYQSLSELIGRPVVHIAYPYGQYNRDTLQILQSKPSYRYAYLACGTFLSAHTLKRPFTLPRMNISNKHFDENFRFLKKRFKA